MQALAVLAITTWSILTTSLLYFAINCVVPFRVEEHEELVGGDYIQHNIHRQGMDVSRAVSALAIDHADIARGLVPVGKNKGHMDYLEGTYGGGRRSRRDGGRRSRVAVVEVAEMGVEPVRENVY